MRAWIDDLQQQVAQFVLQVVHIAALDGVGYLVGFFDGVGRDGREGLLPVPRAAVAGSRSLAMMPRSRNSSARLAPPRGRVFAFLAHTSAPWPTFLPPEPRIAWR